MIIETNQTIYRCEHCRKPYKRKSVAEAHESKCQYNPENYRACLDCVYLTQKRVGWYEGDNEMDNYTTFCQAKGVVIISVNCLPISEHVWDSCGYVEDKLPQEEMPRECKFQKSE